MVFDVFVDRRCPGSAPGGSDVRRDGFRVVFGSTDSNQDIGTMKSDGSTSSSPESGKLERGKLERGNLKRQQQSRIGPKAIKSPVDGFFARSSVILNSSPQATSISNSQPGPLLSFNPGLSLSPRRLTAFAMASGDMAVHKIDIAPSCLGLCGAMSIRQAR